MTVLAERLAEHGIRLKSYATGEHAIPCPECSHTRTKKTAPCLGVKIDEDGATWLCHHCGWASGVSDRPDSDGARRDRPRRESKPTVQKPPRFPAIGALPDQTIRWFADRGIGGETLTFVGVGWGRMWFPSLGAEAEAILFPYRRPGGEIGNVKGRTLAKDFAQVKGGEQLLWLMDKADLSAGQIVITEGEMDALALIEAGVENPVSVPNGAPKKAKDGEIDPENDKAFAYLWDSREDFERIGRIILAGDSDEPGRALEEELARRLGRERCWRVTWPADCGDANETLTRHGPDAVKQCVGEARPYPIKSLHDLDAFESETLALFRDGPKRAFSTGWPSLDQFMKIREGELSVVTGVPGSGKSEFIDALMVNLARDFGWRFAVCSFENPPSEHIAKLAEKHLGQSFWDGPTPRMSEIDLRVSMQWLREHFYMIRADDEAPTIDWILETARAAVLRYGVRGLVIDPYNEIESKRPAAMSETEYVSETLGKVRRFAQSHGVHVWFVAHPAKMHRDRDGSIPVPSLYDISGSAHWVNKADLGVVVHRVFDANPPCTEIYVRKVRFKSVGRIGMVKLRYDPATGRYSDPSDAQGSQWWQKADA